MHSVETHPDLLAAVIAYLKSWRDRVVASLSVPFELQQLMLDQSSIG